MASESSSESTLSITLPGDLDEWLDEQAGTLDMSREQLLIQLLASYRATAELDAEGELFPGDEAIAGALGEQLDEQLTAELTEQLGISSADELDQRIQQATEAAVESAMKTRVSEATNSVQKRLTNRIDTVESEFDQKITDVRERVIQVKKETDKKAPADHSHDELAELNALESRVAEMESELAGLREEFDELVPEHDETLTEFDGRLDELQDRMQTVAWVVSDLRDAHESKGGLETVERIKRAAAKADVERAKCENCGDSVVLSLLTDPECPHCNAAVTNVEAASGWFGSPKLLTASQLESGEEK